MSDLPSVPEAVVLATRASVVLEVIEEAVTLGVRAGVVLSREAAEVGCELRSLAERSDFALLGPNCLGLINANAGISLSSSVSLDETPRPGPLALVAQSGALMGTLHARALRAGLGLGLCVSTGSQAVVRVEDVLLEVAEEPAITAVAAYLEDVDPTRFAESAAALAARGVRLIVLKGGRSARGAAAAASHSGALAGDGRAFKRLAAEVGAVLVDDADELLTTLALAEHAVRRWSLVTFSGGLNSVAADLAAAADVDLPERPVPLLADRGLKRPHNPLDLDAVEATRDEQIEVIAELLRADATDRVLLIVNDMPGLAPFLEALWGAATERLVLCSECSGQSESALRTWVEAGGSYTSGVGQVFRALARLRGTSDVAEAHDLSADAQLLPPADILALLSEQNVAVLPVVEVASEEEALTAAAEIGFPVVLKVSRAAHRGDAVRVSLSNVDEVAAAFRQLEPFAPLIVQPHSAPGLELYVGVLADPSFGWQLLVGPGGRSLEQLADVAVVPADRLEFGIEHVLAQTGLGRWLLGGLGRGLVDLDGLETVARGALRAADALGSRLVSIDLNPVVVSDARAVVVDAKVRLATAPASTGPSTPWEAQP